MINYLTNLPQEIEKYGLCKTLLVRKEVIHYKHILTEIFIRKNINVEKQLNLLNWSLFDYMSYMTNQLRKIHHISRNYTNNVNSIIKQKNNDFFPTIELHDKLNNLIVLDFDGVITKQSFSGLYGICVERYKTVVCSANPEINKEYFIKRNLPLPHKIYACKGKKEKLNKILELNKKHDNIFYIDNEIEYLEFAWIFGIQTYHYTNNKIKYFTLNGKKV